MSVKIGAGKMLRRFQLETGDVKFVNGAEIAVPEESSIHCEKNKVKMVK